MADAFLDALLGQAGSSSEDSESIEHGSPFEKNHLNKNKKQPKNEIQKENSDNIDDESSINSDEVDGDLTQTETEEDYDETSEEGGEGVIKDGKGDATFLAPQSSGGDKVSMDMLLKSVGTSGTKKRLESVMSTNVDVSRVSIYGMQTAQQQIAKEEVKKELGEWMSAVDDSRRQRAVVYDTRGSAGKTRSLYGSDLETKREPISALEAQFQMIHDSQDQIDTAKAIKMNKEDEKKSRAELAILRARLASQATKLAQWSKIKSKSFRKMHKKALGDKEISQLDTDTSVERERASKERQRRVYADTGYLAFEDEKEAQPRNETEIRDQLKAVAEASDDLESMPFGDLPVVKAVSKQRKKEAQTLLDMLDGKSTNQSDKGKTVGVMSFGPNSSRILSSNNNNKNKNYTDNNSDGESDSEDLDKQNVDRRSKAEIAAEMKEKEKEKEKTLLENLAKQKKIEKIKERQANDVLFVENSDENDVQDQENISLNLPDEKDDNDNTFLPNPDEQENILLGFSNKQAQNTELTTNNASSRNVGKIFVKDTDNADFNIANSSQQTGTISIEQQKKEDMEKERQLLLKDAFKGAVNGNLFDTLKRTEEMSGKEVSELKKKTEEVNLPGWGSWASVTKKNNKPRQTQRAKQAKTLMNRKLSDALNKRQDKSLPNVFISQKALDNPSLKLPKVPSQFRNESEFNAVHGVPLGKEFTTVAEFRRSIMPAVIVKGHGAVAPITKEELEAAEKRREAVEKKLRAAKALEESNKKNIPKSGIGKQKRTNKF